MSDVLCVGKSIVLVLVNCVAVLYLCFLNCCSNSAILQSRVRLMTISLILLLGCLYFFFLLLISCLLCVLRVRFI